LEQISSKTSSIGGRQGQAPVLLVNGRRAAGAADLAALPPEAILRVEIYPEKVALEQGFSAGQRVINVVLHKTFSATTAEISAVGSTANAFGDQFADASLFQINGDSRVNISARFAHNSGILAGERGIFVPREIPLSVRGVITGFSGHEIDPTLSALAGKIITMVEVPVNGRSLAEFAAATTQIDPALNDRRTIIPTSKNFGINASIARPIGDETNLSASFGTSLSVTKDILGLSPVSVLISPVTGSLPFVRPVILTKLFDPAPLRSRSRSRSVNAGLNLNGKIGKLNWSTDTKWTGSINAYEAERGVDVFALQRLFDRGTDPLIAGLSVPLLPNDRTRYANQFFAFEAIFGGEAFELPAGKLSANIQIGGDLEHVKGFSFLNGDGSTVTLVRRRLAAAATIEFPITSRERNVFSTLGDLSLLVRVANRWFSDAGQLPNRTLSLNWSPMKRLSFSSTWIDQQEAPTLSQLSAPSRVTPTRIVYDFVRGETVFATIISGGNPDLQPESRSDFRLQANWKPLAETELNFSILYVNTHASNGSIPIPLFTEAVENAFPGRVVRDLSGSISSIDQRDVNIAEQRSEQLNGTVNYSNAVANSPFAGNWSLNVNHRIRLRDERTIRDGLPVLDYLNGAAFSFRGGLPRHEIEAEGGWSRADKGLKISGTWRAGSDVIGQDGDDGQTASRLRFESVLTLNLRAFIDLGQSKGTVNTSPFLRGARLTLKVGNLLNSVVEVRDSNQLTPLRYQPGYLDPYGRTIELSFRKQF
ncbi:MAG: hypothetical protein ACK5OG_04620, partial [Sphingomonadaceae bacterium]